MKKKIGLFGGTFDPIHFGHLNLAIQLQEKAGLDEMWFIPAFLSPLRGEPLCEAGLRKKMVELGIEGIAPFRVETCELSRPELSYTVDTVKKLIEQHDASFSLVLGEDAALSLPRWKHPLELVATLPLLVAARSKIGLVATMKDPSFPREIREAIERGLFETGLFDVEATVVRKRLKERLYCGHLLPSKVLDFIYENQLYYSPL